jgi:hypothetical protein
MTKGTFEAWVNPLAFLELDYDTLPTDAINAYHSAVVLVAKAIGQGVSGGAVVLNPVLLSYLEKAGLYTPTDDGAA